MNFTGLHRKQLPLFKAVSKLEIFKPLNNFDMKTKIDYHKMLEPIVLPYLTAFQNDYHIHDKKALDGYQGEFYYAIRPTGSDIFVIERFEETLSDLINEKGSGTWTARGLRELYYGNLTADNLSYEQYAMLCYQPERDLRFFIGKNGRIKEHSKDEFRSLFRKRLVPVQAMIDQLKGSYFVFQEMEKKQATERAAQMAY
jgi:hypothetical protein